MAQHIQSYVVYTEVILYASAHVCGPKEHAGKTIVSCIKNVSWFKKTISCNVQ